MRARSDNIFLIIILLLGLNLVTEGEISWSVFPVGIFLLFYIMSLTGQKDRMSKDMVILRERFAKGELSEEEFLRRKELIEEEISSDTTGLKYFGGIILIIFGFFLISQNILQFHLPLSSLLPIALILVGLISIFRKLR